MSRETGLNLRKKLVLAVLVFISVPILVLVITIQAALATRQISLQREPQATHVLIVAMDSRNPQDAGLPDSLILLNLADGGLQSIPRDWEKSRLVSTQTLVEFHLGINNCQPFCNIQGVYAFTKLTQPGISSEEEALKQLVKVVSDEYGIPNLGIIVFDLNWAYSFLHRLGNLRLKITDSIPVGGRDSNGEYVGIEREIEPGLRELSGEDLFWFARARHGSSNEARMSRQEELLIGVLTQADLFTLASATLGAKGKLATDLRLLEAFNLVFTIPKLQLIQ